MPWHKTEQWPVWTKQLSEWGKNAAWVQMAAWHTYNRLCPWLFTDIGPVVRAGNRGSSLFRDLWCPAQGCPCCWTAWGPLRAGALGQDLGLEPCPRTWVWSLVQLRVLVAVCLQRSLHQFSYGRVSNRLASPAEGDSREAETILLQYLRLYTQDSNIFLSSQAGLRHWLVARDFSAL